MNATPERDSRTESEGADAPSTGSAGRERSRRQPNFDEIVTPHPVVAFLFRRRTFIVLLGSVAMIPWARPQLQMLIGGMVLCVLATAWRFWAAGTIHKTEQLTTAGPYSHVRHPLYVGSFVHAVGYALMSGRWESFLFVLPLFCAVYGAAVSTEESMLRKLYSEEYEAYSRRVPRFIPRVCGDWSGQGQFAWKQVAANREYINVGWMLMYFGIYLWIYLSQRH